MPFSLRDSGDAHSLPGGKIASLLLLLRHIPADFRLKPSCMRLRQKVGKEKFCVCTKESVLTEVLDPAFMGL